MVHIDSQSSKVIHYTRPEGLGELGTPREHHRGWFGKPNRETKLGLTPRRTPHPTPTSQRSQNGHFSNFLFFFLLFLSLYISHFILNTFHIERAFGARYSHPGMTTITEEIKKYYVRLRNIT